MLYRSHLAEAGAAEAAGGMQSGKQGGKLAFCAKGGGACVGRAYREAVSEFYGLAASLNQSSAAHGISLGEMDLRGSLCSAGPVWPASQDRAFRLAEA